MNRIASARAMSKTRSSAKQQRRIQNRLTDAQTALGWGVLLALAGLLGAIYLYQTSQIATVGRQVQRLQINLTAIKEANGEIERDITEAQSLDRLRQDAARLGFIQAGPDDVEYLVITDYPAETVNEIEEALQAPISIPAESMKEALWILFKKSVNDFVRGESRGETP